MSVWKGTLCHLHLLWTIQIPLNFAFAGNSRDFLACSLTIWCSNSLAFYIAPGYFCRGWSWEEKTTSACRWSWVHVASTRIFPLCGLLFQCGFSRMQPAFLSWTSKEEAFSEAGKPKLWKLGVLFVCRLQKDTQSLPGMMILQDMVLEKQFQSTIRLISGSCRSAVLVSSSAWLRCTGRAGWQMGSVEQGGSWQQAKEFLGQVVKHGGIKEFLGSEFYCKQNITGYPVPWSAVRGPAAAHGFFLELKMSHFKVAGFSFLLLHFLCFLKINKK